MLPTVHGTWAAYASSSTSAADREARELSQRMSCAFAGGGLLILFILILLAMAASGVNKFSGGLVFPYLSDLTRDERVVGAIGLVLSGGLQLQQNVFYAPLYANKVRDALKAKEPHTICSWPTHFFTACLAAGLSNVALILLGIASPIDTPILYEVSNYSNLLLSALALPLFTIAFSQIQRRLPPASWSCSLAFKIIVTILYLTCVLTYLFSLFALPQPECLPTQLTLASCIERVYDMQYCADHLTSDSLISFTNYTLHRPASVLLTTLVDYSTACPTIHNVRGGCQLLSLLLLGLFHASFAIEHLALHGVLDRQEQAKHTASGGDAAAPGTTGSLVDAINEVTRLYQLQPPEQPQQQQEQESASAPALPPRAAAAAAIVYGSSTSASQSSDRRSFLAARTSQLGSSASWADRQLNALYDTPTTDDPDVVRGGMRQYAAGAGATAMASETERRSYDHLVVM